MSKSAAKRVSRQDQACAVRDAAIALMQAGGTINKESNGHNYLTFANDTFSMILRTPFQTTPPIAGEFLRIAVALGARLPIQMNYGLDIWVRTRGKVMNIEWNHHGEVQLVSFRRGDWEAEIFRSAGIAPLQPGDGGAA